MSKTFKSTPDLVDMLIKKKESSARDWIRDQKCKKDVLALLNSLEKYTLEGLAIHIICTLFNPATSDTTLVRAATFIDTLAHQKKYQILVSNPRYSALGYKGGQGVGEGDVLTLPFKESKRKKVSASPIHIT